MAKAPKFLGPHCLCGVKNKDLPLHLSLVIDNHASVILEIDELTIFSSEGFPLTDHHSGHDFFPELWFTLSEECVSQVNNKPPRVL